MKRANGQGSIYRDRRRGGYIVRVTVGRNEVTGRLIRRQRSVARLADAEAALRELRRAYGLSAPKARRAVCTQNLAAYVREYAETFVRPHVRDTTWLNYVALLKRVDVHFAAVPLDALTPVVLQRAANAEKSPHTARRLILLVRSAMTAARDTGLIEGDPTAGVRPPMAQKKRAIRTATPEEAARLIRAAEAPPLRMGIRLQYATGMRAEEALGLTWADIDFAAGMLSVVRVTNQVHRDVLIAPPKSAASCRTLALPARLLADLASYRAWQEAQLPPERRTAMEAQHICSGTGAPVGIHTYASAFRRAAKKADVAITPHGLRHTHATELVAAGYSPKDVQARLGHASVRMTLDTYTHAVPERGKAIAAYIDAIYPSV